MCFVDYCIVNTFTCNRSWFIMAYNSANTSRRHHANFKISFIYYPTLIQHTCRIYDRQNCAPHLTQHCAVKDKITFFFSQSSQDNEGQKQIIYLSLPYRSRSSVLYTLAGSIVNSVHIFIRKEDHPVSLQSQRGIWTAIKWHSPAALKLRRTLHWQMQWILVASNALSFQISNNVKMC